MSSSWTPLSPSSDMGTYCRFGWQGAVAALCVFALSACGQSAPSQNPGTATAGETIPAISAPPGAGDRPLAPGMSGTAKSADGLPILQPRGVNASQLFAEKLSSEDDRMDRLENAVQELRNDFDAMAPSIVKLVAVEKDIQELVGQLETLVSGENAVPPIDSEALNESSPVPAPAAADSADAAPLPLQSEPIMEGDPALANAVAAETPAPATPAPSAAPTPAAITPPPAPTPAPAAAPVSGIAVTAIRIGEHPGKTRIVLDASAKTEFKADLDNAEKMLVVELPDAQWSAEKQKTFAGSPFVASYEVNPSNAGKGTLLVLKLKADATILYKGMMDGDNGGGKIVIDIGNGAGTAALTQ